MLFPDFLFRDSPIQRENNHQESLDSITNASLASYPGSLGGGASEGKIRKAWAQFFLRRSAYIRLLAIRRCKEIRLLAIKRCKYSLVPSPFSRGLGTRLEV